MPLYTQKHTRLSPIQIDPVKDYLCTQRQQRFRHLLTQIDYTLIKEHMSSIFYFEVYFYDCL